MDVGYETGDSVEFEQGLEANDDSDIGSSSGANSESESGETENQTLQMPENEPAEVISKAQKMLRAAIEEELDQISILPQNSNSTTYEDAHNESSHLKRYLKALKTCVDAFKSYEVVWKSPSQKQSSTSSSRHSKSSPISFNATHFLSQFYNDIGGSTLARELKKEFLSNSPVSGSSASSSSSDPENSVYTWQPPTSMNVVGSYLLGTGLRRNTSAGPQYSVDLAITMPEEIFKHRDIKGHRYETKRLLYLAVFAEQFKLALADASDDLACFSEPIWMIPSLDDVSSPLLMVDVEMNLDTAESSKSTSHKKRRRATDHTRCIQIVIRPVITSTTFKLSQLLPWKPQLVFSGNLPNDHVTSVYHELTASVKSIIDGSPAVVQKACLGMVARHNQRIAKDALLTHDNRELAEFLRHFPKLRSAILLAMRWLQPRHLTNIFTTHVVSTMFVYLQEAGHFKPHMDALDLFKAWISWLSKERIAKLTEIERIQTETHGAGTSATRNIHTTPPVLAMQKSKNLSSDASWKTAHAAFSEEMLKASFSECYEVVLVSKSGYLNVLAGVSGGAWCNLTFEAVLASQLLEHPDQYSFGSLFKTSLSHADKAINLRQKPHISSDFDLWLSASSNSSKLPQIPLAKLAKQLAIYEKAEPTTVAQKMQSTAMLGGRKAGSQSITIISTSETTSSQKIDEAKSKEASEWMQSLSDSTVKLNGLDTLSLQKLISESLLFLALAHRVEYLFTQPMLSNQDGTAALSWSLDAAMPSQLSLQFGIRVQPTQWLKLLEYGPQAQQEAEVSDFIKIWGKQNAGLRKFKDGLILYCVSWGVPPTTPSPENAANLAAPANKHRIVKKVVSHLLNRHLSLRLSEDVSSNESGDWNVDMVGDEVLYELLKAPESVDAELMGPTFKTTPAPLNIADSHDRIGFVWTQLQKVLRGLKGLSMPIKSLKMPGTIARGTCAVPPQYNPLSDPEINFSRRQHAIRAGATASQLCPKSVLCLVQFESSGAWPEDLDAISHVKTALYLELARHLGEQQATTVATRCTSDELFIFFKGFTFRLAIFHPRELVLRNTLYRQAVMVQRTEQHQQKIREKVAQLEKMRKIENEGSSAFGSIVPSGPQQRGLSTTLSPELLARQAAPLVGPIDTVVEPLQSVLDDFSRYNVAPKVSGLLHSLNLAYPAYGPTCVLVKKWLGAHLLPLAEFADGLLVDLLVARAFHATPYLCAPWSVPPAHTYAAFLRVLYLLAHLAWEAGPVLVPLHETHEGTVAATLTVSSTQHSAPLGWSAEKIQKIVQRWHATDAKERPLLTICFADGSSGLESDELSSPEEVHANTKLPGVATLGYGTPNGPSTHQGWRVDSFVARAVLSRTKRLALSALSQLETVQEASSQALDRVALKQMFAPSLLDFDLVIELKRSALTSHLGLNWDAKRRSKSSARYVGQTSYLEPPTDYVHQVEAIQQSSKAPPLLPDFNPVESFIQFLSERLVSRSLVFHDATGGSMIAVVLKPSSFVPSSNLTQSNILHALPLSDSRGKRAGIVPNIIQIIGEIWYMGDGIIQQIHLVAGHHKL
jgi:hypothetical protein